MSRRLTARCAAVALLLGPSALLAQGSSAPDPSSAATARGDTASERPVVKVGVSFRLVVAPAALAARLGAESESALAGMRAVCPSARVPSERVPSEPSDSPASGAGAPSVNGDGTLTVVVEPGSAPSDGCQRRWDDGAVGIWSGRAFTRADDSLLTTPARLALVVDGDTIAPWRVETSRAVMVSRTGWLAAGERLAYHYPMSVLAPRGGRWPSMRVLVWNRLGGYAPVELRGDDAQRLAAQYVAWRVASDLRPQSQPIVLRPAGAVHPTVQQALDNAASGHVDRAAQQAARWLGARVTGPDGTRSDVPAKLLLAEAFLARGDTALAATLAVSVRLSHPCLVAPAGASAGMRRLVDARLDRAPCTTVRPTSALLAGLVAPGGGHALVRNRKAARIAAGSIGGVLGIGLVTLYSANRAYGDYQRAASYDAASALYDRANRSRATARRTLGVAAALWEADALLSIFDARRHNARVHDDQQ